MKPTSDNILQLVNVNKSFENDFEVLKDVSFKAKEGEFVCFIGPSGCGKTVLLYTIAGLLTPSSGKILKKDQPINSIGTDRIMVFQDHMLFPWKTVIGNVLFGLENTSYTEKEKLALGKKYLDIVGMFDFKDWPIHKLSGGMKQRVAFARALISEPEILLMDEPFSALDSIARREVRKCLIDIWLKTQQTILFVTHSVIEAVYLADTIYVMSARPTKVRKKYSVNLHRPRDLSNPEFSKFVKKIEIDIEKEFKSKKGKELMETDISTILINHI